MEKIIPTCPNCGAELKYKKEKNWYACPNWKPNNAGCKGFIYEPKKDEKYGKQEPHNGSAMLADEVLAGQKEINERLDKLIALIVNNSKKWEK